MRQFLWCSMLVVALIQTAVADTSPVGKMIEATRPAINRHGIAVWTYQTAGNPAFNYRAKTVVNASLASTVATIMDTDYLSSWVPYTRKIEMLRRDDKQGVYTLRMELDFPFPLQDRDVVVKSKITQAADGTVTIANRATTDAKAPERKNMIRITRYEGSWILRPLSDQQTEVTTVGYADPAGIIPLSIVNMFVQQQPYEMLRLMQDVVRSARYENAQVPQIKTP